MCFVSFVVISPNHSPRNPKLLDKNRGVKTTNGANDTNEWDGYREHVCHVSPVEENGRNEMDIVY